MLTLFYFIQGYIIHTLFFKCFIVHNILFSFVDYFILFKGLLFFGCHDDTPS